MSNWNDATYEQRNDLIFEARNKAYGAYELRTRYNRQITIIIGCMVLFSLALFGLKKVIDTQPEEKEIITDMQNIVVDLTPPPPAEELPPPPPPPPPPPMVEIVKFVPPVIKDDAVEEEPQRIQEEVKDVNVGTVDQEGDDEIVAPPAVEEGPGEVSQEIFMVVEEMPEPPGGVAAFMKYLNSNIKYPAMAREAGISGKAHLKFVIETDGSIGDVQVIKGVPGCGDCDREAVRVIKSFPEKWKPGKQNGRPARVFYNLPVSFKIQ